MSGIISNEKYSLYYQRIGLVYQRPEVRASLEVILSVFTISILIFAAIRPTLTNITSLQKKIDDQEIMNRKADNKIKELFEAQNQLNEYQDKLALYDDAVPNDFTYYSMAARIQYLANKNGVTVETINMPGIKLFGTGIPNSNLATKLLNKDQANIVSAGITFSILGSPQNVTNMITDIENVDRLAMFKSITLTKEVGKAGEAPVLKAAGQIYFYFYKLGT
jgi:hypothetical protein